MNIFRCVFANRLVLREVAFRSISVSLPATILLEVLIFSFSLKSSVEKRKPRYSRTSMCDHLPKVTIAFVLEISPFAPASFPVVLGDFGYDVTRQACRGNSPPLATPLVTRIARTCLVRRLPFPEKPASAKEAIFFRTRVHFFCFWLIAFSPNPVSCSNSWIA